MLEYSLVRSKRRTLSLQISPMGELIARAPMRMSESFIEKFILEKAGWIEKNQKKILERNKGRELKEYSPSDVLALKKLLKNYLETRLPELWDGWNLPKYTTVKITKSERRWGSCSAKNGLCFSYRLAEYLETNTHFIDAIIVHELAHLKQKNHQKPFWNLVYSMMPEYESIMKKVRNGDMVE